MLKKLKKLKRLWRKLLPKRYLRKKNQEAVEQYLKLVAEFLKDLRQEMKRWRKEHSALESYARFVLAELDTKVGSLRDLRPYLGKVPRRREDVLRYVTELWYKTIDLESALVTKRVKIEEIKEKGTGPLVLSLRQSFRRKLPNAFFEQVALPALIQAWQYTRRRYDVEFKKIARRIIETKV